MGVVICMAFMLMGTVAMTVLGYATGYYDGLDKKEEKESEKDIVGVDRKHKRIDFDLRG